MATKLYLGKTKEIPKEDLKRLVSSYGLLKAFEDKDSYCFVDYMYESDARIALMELDGKMIHNTKLVAQFSRTVIKSDEYLKEALPSQNRRVYVGNLNNKFTKEEVTYLFSRFGQINEVIHKDTFALIEFASQQSATNAIMHLNDKKINDEILKVDMQKAYEEVLSSTNRIFVGKIGPSVKKIDLIQHFG